MKYTWDNWTQKYIASDGTIMGWGKAYKTEDGKWTLSDPSKSSSTKSSTKTTTTKDTSNKNTTTKTSTKTSTSTKNDTSANKKTTLSSSNNKWWLGMTEEKVQKTAEDASAKAKSANRKVVDWYRDSNWNVVEIYSDWSKSVNWVFNGSDVKANNIPNWSKAANEWDYKADISKDKTRQKELLYNIKQYAETNSQLFKNRQDFEKYFNYDWRDKSQQAVLDYAWDNYNKFWLNSDENKVADDASEIADKKWRELINQAMKDFDVKSKNYQRVYDEINPKYQWLLDKYNDLYQRAFDEVEELKRIAREYYANTKALYDEQSAWEAASVESRLSAQWLWYTAIGSATTGVGNHWAARYNNLLQTHLNNLMNLQGKWVELQSSILGNMKWITDSQKELISDYMTSLNDLYDKVSQAEIDRVNAIYKPYETISDKKVETVADQAWTASKVAAKNASYAAMNNVEKRNMLINNLITIYWEWVDLSTSGPYFAAIEQAVKDNPTDWQRALYQAVGKLQAAWVKVKSKGDWWWGWWGEWEEEETITDEGIEIPEWWSKEDWDMYQNLFG